MKQFTFRWLKRFYILIAISLVLLAVLLSSARILFISVGDYKEQAIDWLTREYQINISVEDISAGIDFSGMVLTLANVELLDSDDLPFVLELEHLFLHLDFWDSVTQQKMTFNSVSLLGANLTVKKVQTQKKSEESQLTINTLKDIFLTQLKKVSIKNSNIFFTDQLDIEKSIMIEQLRWLNEGEDHQGTGLASLPDSLGENSFKFVVDLSPKTKETPLAGNLYIQADNLNVTDYLIKQVNSNAVIDEAVVGFEAWAKFSSEQVESTQIKFNKSLLSWTLLESSQSWGLNSGLLQLTNSDTGWLLDSYELGITHNEKEFDELSISGQGNKKEMQLNFDDLSIKKVIPFYLLFSDLNTDQITSFRKFGFDGHIDQFGLSRGEGNNFQFGLQLKEFRNRPVGGVPGVSNANIIVNGNAEKGNVDIRLPKQKIFFDGQFSRPMPVKSGLIPLKWLNTETGYQLSSEQVLLKTNELDTTTEFSIFLPNKTALNQSMFLSLYSYASLNDASKAQYYFPMKAMGDDVFKYLEPTILKGHVKGAQILWYGAFNHYPYLKNNGIFQAKVPLRDAQYDFYGDWEGLKNLDLDLLFENDYLLMDAKKASLGKVNVGKLTAKVDHLNPRGILTVKADIKEDAQKINDYLKASPLKESVGKAVSIIEVTDSVSGNIKLTIPFDREKLQTKSEGKIFLKNNKLDFELADNLILPLKQVNGSFSFINGDLSTKNISASLFEQPLHIAFSSKENKNNYQVKADINGVWKLDKLSKFNAELKPFKLSGPLDWSGNVDFSHQYTGGYNYDVALHSSTLGMVSKLPAPFHKNKLHTWPTAIKVSGNDNNAHMQFTIKDKLSFEGVLDYQRGIQSIPYFNLNIGQLETVETNKTKQVININLEKFNVLPWYDYWLVEQQRIVERKAKEEQENTVIIEDLNEFEGLISTNEININIKQLNLFNQPLVNFNAQANKIENRWEAKLTSDKLISSIEYRNGIPARFDINAEKVDFQTFDFSLLQSKPLQKEEQSSFSENLRKDYPEFFVDCKICIYKDIDLSPMSTHLFPTKKRLNIDYIKIGEGSEFTEISGFWNQRLTNIIVDTEGDKDGSLVSRFGYTSPVTHKKAQLTGAFNWVGAPWEMNFTSLNGAFSSVLTDGAITEVSDNGARLLSLFSLDGIRRSLNVEFDNVFAKGFNFDELTFNGNVNDGILSNDDFYLNGSAGKITGSGLVDLPNQHTNYKFSYSPAVTSSLPVLAAFAINPLTGAAVLVLTKILEPVVDTIIQVDFTVKGELNNPAVELVTRQRGTIKLENSEVLQEMSEQQNKFGGAHGG